jgi:hypothetical protein
MKRFLMQEQAFLYIVYNVMKELTQFEMPENEINEIGLFGNQTINRYITEKKKVTTEKVVKILSTKKFLNIFHHLSLSVCSMLGFD